MTHGYTTTYTNDPVSPVKAAQTEIAPVLLCVCHSSIIQLCLFQMLSMRSAQTVCSIQRDELKSRSLPLYTSVYRIW